MNATSLLRSVLVAIVLVAVGACGSDDEPAATQPTESTVTTTPPESTDVTQTTTGSTTGDTAELLKGIAGIDWVLEAYITIGGPEPLPNTNATMRIDGSGRIDIDTGCNTGSGQLVDVQAGMFTVADLAMTEVACEGVPGNADAALRANFAGPVSWAITDDGKLRITPLLVSDSGLEFVNAAG